MAQDGRGDTARRPSDRMLAVKTRDPQRMWGKKLETSHTRTDSPLCNTLEYLPLSIHVGLESLTLGSSGAWSLGAKP